jgi:hypothetical protein
MLNRLSLFNKRAQSEMVGFALILIIVMVLIFVFLSVSKNEENESEILDYEPNSFLQSLLFHSTSCEVSAGLDKYGTIEKTMKYCVENRECLNDIDPCKELEEELSKIVEKSWNVGENSKNKGYSLNLTYRGEPIYGFSDGIKTPNYRYASQKFDGGRFIEFSLYR